MSMDEIIPGLWIGDLPSALDTEKLKANRIYSVLSAMRGTLTVHETFVKHQILIDDDPDADILVHLIPATTFIQAELDKGRGVLVHCQAGMSRSASIVAAYLMYSRNLDLEAALALIRTARPSIDPNPGFLTQLNIFHQTGLRRSSEDKLTRMYYLQKATEGDISHRSGDMLAQLPQNSPGSKPVKARRRIRCKMCRQELASREHMFGHTQIELLGPSHFSMNITSPTPQELVSENSLTPRNESHQTTSTDDYSIQTAIATGSLISDSIKANGYQVTPESGPEQGKHSETGTSSSSGRNPGAIVMSPPILTNPKCSGYFVEPMKWMDHFLNEGHTAGKIICPNKKCSAKLGNYDWAGVCCGCKEWVTPGFCINRSKVDEIG